MASKIKKNPPKVSEMVLIAIAMLNERNGSSMQAIKKYITNSFNVETKNLQWNIKKYLIIAVQTGTLVRTKGKGGVQGSFRLGGAMKGKMSELLAKISLEKHSESPAIKNKSESKKNKKNDTLNKSETPKTQRKSASKKGQKNDTLNKSDTPKIQHKSTSKKSQKNESEKQSEMPKSPRKSAPKKDKKNETENQVAKTQHKSASTKGKKNGTKSQSVYT